MIRQKVTVEMVGDDVQPPASCTEAVVHESGTLILYGVVSGDGVVRNLGINARRWNAFTVEEAEE